MLVLTRMRDQVIRIGEDIEVQVVDIRGDKVRLGINAPDHVAVHRQEIYERIKREARAAAGIRAEDIKRNEPEAAPFGPRQAEKAGHSESPGATTP
jgi:carbon storage regulator